MFKDDSRIHPQVAEGYALITGASSGIGEEFARQLAARGRSLILVARSQDRLEQLRVQLITAHPRIDVRCIALDLSAAAAPMQLFQKTQAAGLTVTLLINNAGFGAFGEFASVDRERLRQMIDLNNAALIELSHLYFQPMYRQTSAQRRQGGIINIASVAAFVPLPYSAVYSASKAFVLSFSRSLYEEARQHGVHVMVVNPGTTSTNFFEVAGRSPLSNASRMQTASQVVDESLRAFDRGERSVTTGISNRAIVRITRLFPSHWIARFIGYFMRRARRTAPPQA